MSKENFEYSTKIKDKEVKFRKWKVKDKKKFLSNKDNPLAIKEALVYDCLEDSNLALSEEEYNYLLVNIREESINEKVQYDFTCSHCNKEFEYSADLSAIMKPTFGEYGDIIYKNQIFTMTNLRNRDFYENAILNTSDNETKKIIDFILHIESYNDQDGMSFDDLIEVINNLDIDVFEKIFLDWEKMRFKVDNIETVKCPHCNKTEKYEFDNLPGFFPESWDV